MIVLQAKKNEQRPGKRAWFVAGKRIWVDKKG